MKKYLLLFLMCVYASIGAWAVAVTVSTDSNGLTTVTCTDNGSSEVTVTGSFPAEGSISNIKVVGPFTTGVSDKIATALGNNFSSFTRLDLSKATGVTTSTLSTYSIVGWSKMGYIKHLILPTGASVPTAAQLKNNTSGSLDPWDAMEYFVIPQSDGTCDIYLTEVGLTSISDADIIIDNKSASTVTVHLAEGEDESPATEATKTTIENYLKTQGYKLFVAPYTVSGCNVSINMDGAEAGQTLADLIATAKAAVIAGGETGICTLTVTGELTANDLIALGGTNMTGATRIDLSGATVASGASIGSIQLPSSLTQLVLPEDQTVDVALKSKLAAATNLWYAYSPSSDSQKPAASSTASFVDTKNLIADYVWVNKAGGLAQAFTNEELLRNSYYIKVASEEELNTADVDFNGLGTNKPTNYLFLDFSASNLTPAMAANYTVTDNIGYRIILPNDWSVDDMAVFAALPQEAPSGTPNAPARGNLAAVYSYSGTTLKIMEITDGSYMPTALKNPRIVRSGTTAIEVVGKLVESGGNYYQYGDLGDHLIAALNQADDAPNDNTVNNIKTININLGNTAPWSGKTLTLANTNIENLSVIGIKDRYNNSTGPALVVDGCTALKTLDVSDAVLTSLDASMRTLTTANLSGATITGVTDLSNSGLLTFTTTSSTKLQGDLNLMNTALTSFATAAEIGTTTSDTGNIFLNGSTSLTSINVASTQFKNATSKIHVDKSTAEDAGNTDAIDGITSIQVPSGFTSSTRIHPYDEVSSVINEAAASGDGSKDGDLCYIEYDADTKTATAHINTAGHLADLLYSSYASYPEGTTFKFAAGSQINEYDLEALAGYIKKSDNTEADYSWRTNYYYVDLYDLTATDALCNYQTGTITNVINWLRTNDRQFKGLILPKDHTLYGSGISLIQSENPKHEGELSTCSEFIAYFKTKDMVNNAETSLPKKILFTHVYNQTATNSAAIQASNDKLTELLTAHGLNGAAENCPVDLYSVSTNGTTPFNATALVGSKGYVETFNNEMVGPDTRANIYAYPSAAGEFTTFVDHSSIGVTTTEVMKIDGTVSSDASAVAASINRFTNGPRVLDLKGIKPNSDEFLSALLPALTNSNIEYIILPEGKSKELVCNTTYSDLTSLKAVISSSNTDLVAYVKQAGSLAEARYLATGGSTDGTIFSPSQTGLQSVTLAGNLNASDIAANTTSHFLDEYGNWKTTSGNQKSVALWGEQGTISTIDLKDAVFATQTDMNFSYAGLSSLHDITLPTSASMTLIPAECFMGITTFNDLCIPYNYTKIDNAALLDTYCGHITTTDALNGAVVDNGEHSYTFSANLEEIGSKPSTADANGVYSLSRVVFPQNRGVTDVYVLAHKVPMCYANAFPANMLYGWGGFKGGDFPYCREKYDNSADGSMIFTVLHFPDEASYTATASTDRTGSSYVEMEKLYTDINKVYTKKEQTGAVDANGDPIAWPSFAELRRAYNQATDGITWNDWTLEKDGNGEVLGGSQIPTAKNAITAGTGEGTYPFENYEGWHQFVLSMATYVEPAKTVENEIIKTDYVQGAWYTLCIPFSLTLDQAIEILGIPKSVEKKTENYLDGVLVEEDKLPDVRTLQTVTRTPGTTNTVTMKFTQNLLADGLTRYWSINYSDPDQSNYSQGTSSGNSIAIRGGYPYLIRPYLPANEVVKNLGKYIMTRYGDKFEQARSCIYIDGCAQDLAPYSSSQKTGRFAKPFEGHKIQAVWDDNNNATPKYRTHSDGKNYNYTFVGQFWDQKLPRYCFYMVENSDNTAGKWYRLASDKNYQWNQYKCVIMVTQEVNDVAPEGREDYLYTNSGKFRNNDQNATTHSIYPASIGTDAQGAYKFEDQLYIEFLNGLDDADFTEVARAKYVFAFDDFIQEFDENGNSTTSIESIDGESVNTSPKDGKVYSISGQYVGDSLDGLAKGIYIINGKKFIVR